MQRPGAEATLTTGTADLRLMLIREDHAVPRYPQGNTWELPQL